MRRRGKLTLLSSNHYLPISTTNRSASKKTKLYFFLGILLILGLIPQLFFSFQLPGIKFSFGSKQNLSPKVSGENEKLTLLDNAKTNGAGQLGEASITELMKKMRDTKEPDIEAFEDSNLYNDQDGEQVGNVTYLPSFGTFPRGCKWRLVKNSGSKETRYQFWVPDTSPDFVSESLSSGSRSGHWSSEQPAACDVSWAALPENDPSLRFRNDSPRSEVSCTNTYCMYHNLYYNNGRWYVLVDGNVRVPNWRFCNHQEITALHVRDAAAFLQGVKYRFVRGDTMVFGFVHYTHPTAIGHWWEMLAPMYSYLKKLASRGAASSSGNGTRVDPFRRPCDQVVVLHLKRQHLFEWVRSVLAVALGVPRGGDLPPLLFQAETADSHVQIHRPLEGAVEDTWIIFERVAIIRNVGFGSERGFDTGSDAREFRDLVYEMNGLPLPRSRVFVPRVITFQRKRSDRRILNERALLDVLRKYADVQVVEYNGVARDSSLHEQLKQMYRTGLFVSAHTSNLANAPLLPPGSAVLEIIQRNWASSGLDQFFRNQTRLMGDIRHSAWVARWLNQTVFINPDDYQRVGRWSYTQCFSEACIEASTQVDVIVDVEAIDKILQKISIRLWGHPDAPAAHRRWPPKQFLDPVSLEPRRGTLDQRERGALADFDRALAWPANHEILNDTTPYAGLTHKPGEFF